MSLIINPNEHDRSSLTDKPSMEHEDERALRAQREKHARFMSLLEPCLARLSRYCHAMTEDWDDGRDLLSDAILLAYDNFEKLRVPEAFLSYIFTTARRLYYRRAKRNGLWERIGDATHEIADEHANPAELRLDLDALDRALAKLPEKQREAVILFEISELSLNEIREIQGGSLSGVKSRIVRGREKLAELLGEQQRGRTYRKEIPRANSRKNVTSFPGNAEFALIEERL